MRRTTVALIGALVGAVSLPACTDVGPRNPPPRGSLGQELFGIVCDRVGAQTLHEDLTGASYHSICHADQGPYAMKVDQSVLPELVDGLPDHRTASRCRSPRSRRSAATGSVASSAWPRTATSSSPPSTPPSPTTRCAIRDLGNADPTRSCGAPASGAMGPLHTELANLLARFLPLYDDGTLPHSTEALGGLVSAYNQSPAAQNSWAAMNARQGYRPVGVALGALRPVLAYPKLRELTNATLRLLAPDSDPYTAKPQLDAQGNRVPVPGAVYPQVTALSDALSFELANEVDDPVPSPLVLPISHDAMVGGRTVLGRPRSDMEMLTSILFAEDPTFVSGLSSPAYVAQRDPRGFVALAPPGRRRCRRRSSTRATGLPAIDPVTGQFKTTNGMPAPSPFFAPGATDDPTRDGQQRALASGGAQVYGYVNTAQSFESRFIAHLRGVTAGKSLVDSNPADGHETIMNLLAGAYVLFGPRSMTSRTHGSTSLEYNGFQPVHAPMGDLVYALGNILADPTADSTLAFASTLMKNNPNDVARVIGDVLWAKDQSNADTTAKIPAQSTFWDEMIDVLVLIAQDTSPSTDPKGRRLLEDILSAFAQPASLGLLRAPSRARRRTSTSSPTTATLSTGPRSTRPNPAALRGRRSTARSPTAVRTAASCSASRSSCTTPTASPCATRRAPSCTAQVSPSSGTRTCV